MSAAIDVLAVEFLHAMLAACERDPSLAARLRSVLGEGERNAHPPVPEAVYMAAREFAGRLGVSLRTVRTWTAQGLPYVGSGRLRRIDVRAADAWLADRSDEGIANRARRDVARRVALRAVGGE